MEWVLLLLALVLTGMQALFVATEFSLVTVSRQRLATDERPRARTALEATGNLSTELSGAQLGITVTTISVGFLAEPSVARLLEQLLPLEGGSVHLVAVPLALVLVTLVQMVFGELVPKNLAIARPYDTALYATTFSRGFTRRTRWVVHGMNRAANGILKLVRIEPAEELRSGRNAAELVEILTSSEKGGKLQAVTAEQGRRGLAFGEKNAYDVLTPRVQVSFLSQEEPASTVLERARDGGHSRFPVTGEGFDDIRGTVHLKDVLALPQEERTAPIARVMRPALILPGSVNLPRLLSELRRGGLQMAVLVDEYGGTAGIATLEDLVEELVGEVGDEHDPHEELHLQTGEGRWKVSGLLRPDEVATYTGVELPDDERYDTLAGLIMAELGRIPVEGETLEVTTPQGRAVLEVVRIAQRRIEWIELTLPEKR